MFTVLRESLICVYIFFVSKYYISNCICIFLESQPVTKLDKKYASLSKALK